MRKYRQKNKTPKRLIYDIFPPEKVREIAGNITGFKAYETKRAKLFAVSWRLVLLTAFLFFLTGIGPANAADRYWVGGAGTWDASDTTHWAIETNGAGGASVPGSTDNVYFDSSSDGGSGAFAVTVDAAINIAGFDLNEADATINVGANTFTATSFSIANGAFNAGSTTVDINGAFAISGGTFTSTTGNLQVSGGWTHTAGGTFTHNSGTVIFDGAAATINIDAAVATTSDDFYSITISKNNYAALTISSGDILIVNDGGTLTLTNGKIITGTIDISAGNSDNLSDGSGFDGGTGIIYINNGSKSITLTSDSVLPDINLQAGTIICANGGTNTFAADLTVASGATFTTTNSTAVFLSVGGGSEGASSKVDVPTTLDFNNVTINKAGGFFQWVDLGSGDTIVVQGTLTLTDGTFGAGTIQAQGDVTVASTFDGGAGTLQFTGGNTQTWTDNGGKEPTGTITINKTAGTVVNLASAATLVTAGQDLTITQGILDLKGYDLTLTGAGDVLTVTDTLQLDGNETITASTKTLASGSTVIYTGDGNSDVDTYTITSNFATTYYHLTINSTDTGDIFQLGAAASIDGTLTVTQGILSLAGYDLTDTAGGDTASRGNIASTVRLQGAESIFWTANDTDTGTYEYVGDGAGGTTSFNIKDFGGTDYYNLTINSTAGDETFSLTAALDINGDLLISSGTLSTSGTNYQINLAGVWTNNAAFTANSGKVVFDGASATILSGSSEDAFYDVEIGDGATAMTKTIDTTLDVDHDLTITASATLDTKSGENNQINVGGSWTNNGTFTPRSGAVVFDTTATATIAGSTSFNSFTCETGAKQINFTAGTTQTITGTLTLNGSSGNLITLRSTSTPTQWSIDPQSTRNVSYLDVKDSNNINSTIINPSNSTDSGNNTNWFPASPGSSNFPSSPPLPTVKLLVALPGQSFVPGTGITGSPSPQKTGDRFSFYVYVTDADNKLVTAATYTYSVAITSSDAQAILPSANLVSGSDSFNITLNTAGSQTITALASGLASGSQTLTVTQTPPVVEKIKEEIKEVSEEAKEVIKKIAEIPKFLIPEILKPEPQEIPLAVPLEELVPKEAPLAFKGQWTLVSYTLQNKPFIKFTLAPLPKEIQRLAEKFPRLERTFKEIGITSLIDIEKLRPIKLTLPGLTEKLGLPTKEIKPGKLSLPKGVPVAKLSPEIKGKIPIEIVFAKTGGELIDFNIALSFTEKGKPQQKISTISGKPLNLTVKPEKPVKSVKGYVVFKSKKKELGIKSQELPLNSLLASMVFALPSLAQNHDPAEIETRLVLLEFEYIDPDGDGIYTAQIQAPIVEGEYEIITVMDYEDPKLGTKEIRLITVVDPEGYVYEKIKNQELRIAGAIVSLYRLNPETKQYELWPAKEYQQENPQATDVRGTYSFLVPEGYYYLKIEAPGYLLYQGKSFQVKESGGVHLNIELKTKYWMLKIVDLRTILLVVVIFLLFYNFYRDKIRERRKI